MIVARMRAAAVQAAKTQAPANDGPKMPLVLNATEKNSGSEVSVNSVEPKALEENTQSEHD